MATSESPLRRRQGTGFQPAQKDGGAWHRLARTLHGRKAGASFSYLKASIPRAAPKRPWIFRSARQPSPNREPVFCVSADPVARLMPSRQNTSSRSCSIGRDPKSCTPMAGWRMMRADIHGGGGARPYDQPTGADCATWPSESPHCRRKRCFEAAGRFPGWRDAAARMRSVHSMHSFAEN